MTRTEQIAAAIATELRDLSPQLNHWNNMRSIVFDVKMKASGGGVRVVLVRPEFGREIGNSGNGLLKE